MQRVPRSYQAEELPDGELFVCRPCVGLYDQLP
jgi:hypothetical protein